MRITPKQAEQYRRDGFLTLENFVSGDACDLLKVRAEELVSQFDPQGLISIFSTREQSRVADDYFLTSGDKIRFFFEEAAFLPDGSLKQAKEKSINKIGHALHELDSVFRDFSRTADIRNLVSDLQISSPLLIQSMYIFKQPNIGGEVSCHQDSTFLYTEPFELVGLWFAIEDATIENGCLWALPGGHMLGLKSRWVRTPQGRMEFQTLQTPDWPENKLRPLEVKKGALVVLHGLLPHKSLANRSATSRHTYTLHVMSGNVRYPSDNWLQRPADMPFGGF